MEVRFNSTLRGLCGQRSLQIELSPGATVRDALRETEALLPVLAGKILDGRELHPAVVVFLGGRNIRFHDGLESVLSPDDVVDIFPRTGAQRAFAPT